MIATAPSAADRAAAAIDSSIRAQTRAELASWPEPIVDTAEPPALPASLLPDWLGAYCASVARALQVPETLIVGFALSALSAAVQRRFVVAPHGAADSYREELAFWSLTSAPSGARKSSVVSAFTRSLATWEKRAGDAMRRTIAANRTTILVGEALVKRLQMAAGKADDGAEREQLRQRMEDVEADMPERIYAPCAFLGDVTVERLQQVLVEQGGRAAVLADEGGIFATIAGTYGTPNGAPLDALLQGYSGGDVRVSRASRSAFVDRACVTVGLMLQPDLLADAAGSGRFRASGLMARFAYMIPKPFIGTRDVRQFTAIDADVRGRYERSMLALLGDGADGPHAPPRVLEFASDAAERWTDFHQTMENRMGEGGDLAAIADWAAKHAGRVARIAALFELVRSGRDAECVSLASMDAATQFGELLVPHARQAFRLLAADQTDRDADAIQRWALRHNVGGRFTQSDLVRGTHGRFPKRERFDEALLRLQGNSILKRESSKRDGRTVAAWRINPKLLAAAGPLLN